jgi:diguanylate cyclase (GGDEF)-like protein/PAS domain S-box-containing protein
MQKLARVSQDFAGTNHEATIASLWSLLERYQTALSKMSQGVCYFDGQHRLVLSNARYAELYNLSPADIWPGLTLREITEKRIKAGTCTIPLDDYLDFAAGVNSMGSAQVRSIVLNDGRTIQIFHEPMPDGGWVATHDDITELQAKRAASEELLSRQKVIDLVPDYMWVKDRDSKFITVNKALAKDWGRDDPAQMIGLNDFDFHPHEIACGFRADEVAIITTGQAMIDKEELVVNADGSEKWILSTKVPLRDKHNEIKGIVGVSRNITERKRAELLLNGQAQLLEMIASSAPLEEVLTRHVYFIESQLRDLSCSILMLDPDGLHLRTAAAPNIPKAYSAVVDGVRIGPKVGSCGTAAFRRETVIVTDIMNDPLWADFRDLAAAHDFGSCWSTPIFSSEHEVLGTFAMYSSSVREPTAAEMDLVALSARLAGIAIERRRAEDRIRHMAHHDALTGLPNRTLLDDRLKQAVSSAERHDTWIAVAFLDVDNFKTVNDSLGHNAGDDLLKSVAHRMLACVRSTDTVVRIAGDEFVIVLRDVPKDFAFISQRLQKIRAAISEPIELAGHDIKATSSMGVAIYPNDGADPDTLLANADAAMYRVKEQGRDNMQFFTPDMSVKVQDKLRLQNELRNALANCEFTLLYQPQADLQSGNIFAVEALIRWNHPTQGMIPPDRFIPIAEEIGLIVPMGDWVLHEACRQAKSWQDQGLPPMSVCVNVSPRQFREKNLVGRVINALQESGLDPKYLDLEITEGLIMQDIEQAVQTMRELSGLGVQISIDDFGTGYSSLSALKTFPVARLKIDKSFIDNLSSSESDKAVTSAVISLGQKLNLKVIAEGVETSDQVDFLRENKCDEIQGYYLSRPITASAIEKLLRSPLNEKH